MKARKLTFTLILLAVIIISCSGYFAVTRQMLPMRERNAEIRNQATIANAMVSYARRHEGVLPTELKQLVIGGFLPEVHEMYSSPYHARAGKAVNYQQSSYYITGRRLGDSSNDFYIQRHTEQSEDKTVPHGYIEINSVIANALDQNSVLTLGR